MDWFQSIHSEDTSLAAKKTWEVCLDPPDCWQQALFWAAEQFSHSLVNTSRTHRIIIIVQLNS